MREYDKSAAVQVAEVSAAAAKIQDDTTLLGVTGTLAPATVWLVRVGYSAGAISEEIKLPNCNIGTINFSLCYTEAITGHKLDLSDNRLVVGTTGYGPGIRYLIEQLYAAIVTASSGATVTLDITGNAEPAGTTITKIEALVSAGCTISYEGQ